MYGTFSSDGTSSAVCISSSKATENRHPLYAVAALCMCKTYVAKQQKPPRLLGCGAVPCCLVHTGVPGGRYSLQLLALPSLPVICTVTAASVSGGLS